MTTCQSATLEGASAAPTYTLTADQFKRLRWLAHANLGRPDSHENTFLWLKHQIHAVLDDVEEGVPSC